MNVKTSETHPLGIAEVEAPNGGVVGITFCPGKHQDSAFSGVWRRDLQMDVDAVETWGAKAVVTLVTRAEMKALNVERLGEEISRRGMKWVHLPIEDVTAPTSEWESRWREARANLHAILQQEGRVLVHCKGGLGRAGTVAARLLMEQGVSAVEAIRQVRAARGEGAIEGPQPAYLRALPADALLV
jgi:protein-tyrosine phosphatase